MSDNQTKNMSVERLVMLIEWLASAGAQLAISRDVELAEHPGQVQAIFEAIEGAAADLYERLGEIEREATA